MYGLVLEGGGAKGSYHIGAYKALRDLNLEIGGIAGTSIGALNGAAIVQGELSKLEKLWTDTKASDLFDIDEKELNNLLSLKIDELNISYFLNLSKKILTDGGLDITRIKDLVYDFIDEEKIRKSCLDFGIVTINLTDKQPMELLKEEIPEGKLVDYLLASANLPAFKQEKRDGKNFLDGGIYDNLPIGVLERKGYTDFIAIRTFGIGRVKKYDEKKLNIIYIQPVESLGGTLDFNVEQSKRNMKLGYYDTLKVFKNLRGYKYYCEPFEENFTEYMIKMVYKNSEKIKNIGKILGFSELPIDRLLFEKIMPRLEALMEMKGNYDYQDIIIRMAEIISEKYESIEKFKVYKSEKFIESVIFEFKKRPLESSKNVPAFIKHNKLLSITVKENIIIEIFREMFIE